MPNKIKIVVVGVGGCGNAVLEHIMENAFSNVTFVSANTDAKALRHSKVETKLQLGIPVTGGLGAGAEVAIGRQAALDSNEEIRNLLKGYDLVFIIAGMGRGTGTGATPVIAQLANEMGMTVIALVSTPFSFEGSNRKKLAEAGIDKLSPYTHSLSAVPNDTLISVAGTQLSMNTVFELVDVSLSQAAANMIRVLQDTTLKNHPWFMHGFLRLNKRR